MIRDIASLLVILFPLCLWAGEIGGSPAEGGGTNFPHRVFKTEDSFLRVKDADTVQFCRLSGVTQSHYIEKARLFAQYPVVSPRVRLDSEDCAGLFDILLDSNAYRRDGRFGIGFPRWDGLLAFASDRGGIDVLIWREPAMVQVVQDGLVVGMGTLKKSLQREFVLQCDKLLSSGETLEHISTLDTRSSNDGLRDDGPPVTITSTNSSALE